MPQLKVQTASGDMLFNYVISTPHSDDAQAIDPTLPTILFLHPVYVASVVFHNQFASPLVRRFNLIALDARCHGSTVGAVPPTFRRADMADDVSKFMDALNLPPCHLAGVSLGACVALQMAVSHRKQVLSLFLISPLPLIEPEDVALGRQEIFDCWVAGRKDENADEDALLEAIFGALQLGFNQSQASIVAALVQYTYPQALRNWAPPHFDEFHTISVEFFVDREPHALDVLHQAAGCPVHLVHCGGDIAYPMGFVEELRDHLASADINVSVSQVDHAPHFGCVTHSEPINTLLHDWVMVKTKGHVPQPKVSVASPFERDLVKCGYRGNGNTSSDSEDDLIPI